MQGHAANKWQSWEHSWSNFRTCALNIYPALLSREEGKVIMGGDHMISDLGPEGQVGKATGKRKGKWGEGIGSHEWWVWDGNQGGRSGMAKKSGHWPEKDEEPLKGQIYIIEKSLWLQWRLRITWVQTGGKKTREKSNLTKSWWSPELKWQ